MFDGDLSVGGVGTYQTRYSKHVRNVIGKYDKQMEKEHIWGIVGHSKLFM